MRDGAFHAYYVYDVADTIALERLVRLAGAGVAQAPLQLRREASSGFIGFPTPPVVARIPHAASDIGIRAKLYDYGVVSIRLSLPFAGPWNAFAAFTRRLRNDDDLSQLARRSLDGLLAEIGDALDDPHPPLIEDYFVFEVESFAAPVLATELLGEYASALASLVLCEERPLMPRAQEEALRANFSYFDDDLTVVQWDTAFVYDRREGAAATLDILEFANTQLVELRTYDTRLDDELDTIYKLDPKRPTRRFRRKQAQDAADRLRYLIVDILELTDRASNALKIIGDAYYARLYRGAAGRLGLKDWQQQIDSKLQSVNEMYRFFTDQAQAARGEFMEAVIIFLIVLEI
ncbi:MAG TPA: hypothetical protein VKG44_10490, partial [Candidatus Baltobacteraceae bacterium]|nr:hypothetical protein [Candidatus Baltobacteraceae bacterium]